MKAVHGTLFLAALVAACLVPALGVWPLYLLVPIMAYLALVACVPSLRRSFAGLPCGRFTRVTAVASLVVIVVASAVLIGFQFTVCPIFSRWPSGCPLGPGPAWCWRVAVSASGTRFWKRLPFGAFCSTPWLGNGTPPWRWWSRRSSSASFTRPAIHPAAWVRCWPGSTVWPWVCSACGPAVCLCPCFAMFLPMRRSSAFWCPPAPLRSR